MIGIINRPGYRTSMMLLTCLAIITLVAELQLPQWEPYFDVIDWLILFIFSVDYFLRLIAAPDKTRYLLHNIPDLIAIVPFNRVFRVARLLRLVRFARLSRVIRLVALAQSFITRFSSILKTNGLHFILGTTVIVIVIGAGGLFGLEYGINPGIESFWDALWWSLVTTTTVGYGDIAPITFMGRTIAGILMVFGIGFVGMVTATLATYFIGMSKERAAHTETLDKSQVLIEAIRSLTPQELQYLKAIIEIACTNHDQGLKSRQDDINSNNTTDR